MIFFCLFNLTNTDRFGDADRLNKTVEKNERNIREEEEVLRTNLVKREVFGYFKLQNGAKTSFPHLDF